MFRITALALFIAMCLSASAALIDDARRQYREGDYTAAAETARKILKSKPRDGSANFFLGASLLKLGNPGDAIEYLEKAESRSVGEASQLLAEYALSVYDVDMASEHLDTWERNVTKARKELPEVYSELSSQIVALSNMLQRVEKIEILDSLSVDSATFFNAYRHSRQAGRILPPEAVSRIGAGINASELSTAYMPENNSEILWAAADDNGSFSIYSAGILDDGTLDHPERIDLGGEEGANAAFPFLMPDGVTMYYAYDGEGSIGGYDIFMTRRNDDGSYYQGQNIGMPYNSTSNDYLLAIDETSGLGWWATDRNSPEGKVTVYIFSPSQMRVNVEPDNENLHALALLTDMSLTQNPETDYSAVLESRLPDNSSNQTPDNSASRFALDMGNGKIYTSLSDFHSEQARSAMLEYLVAEAAFRKHMAAEQALREKYRLGDKSVASDILASEKETVAARSRLTKLRNAAIRLENK